MTALLTLEEVYRGAELSLDLSAPELAPDGSIRRVPKTIRIRVPKGATDGQRLRVPGKGGPGSNGGPPGDLYLNIVLRPHPLYKASDHDLTLDFPVTPSEAVLGAEIEVPTLDGRVKLHRPPGLAGWAKAPPYRQGSAEAEGRARRLILRPRDRDPDRPIRPRETALRGTRAGLHVQPSGPPGLVAPASHAARRRGRERGNWSHRAARRRVQH